MIKIYPDFIQNDIIDTFLKSVDWSLEKQYPNNTSPLKYICPIRYPEINSKAAELGNIKNVELLSYKTGAYTSSHIDDYELVDGDLNWTMTGILLMSHPTEYAGGDLIFNDLNIMTKLPRGTMITFPAGSESKKYTHSVNVVTAGQRNVLVYRYAGMVFNG